MAGKETVAAIRTAATTGTAIAIEITPVLMETPKVFRERAIIMMGKETVTMATKTSRKDGATGFDKGEKYIWINSDIAIFTWGEGGRRRLLEFGGLNYCCLAGGRQKGLCIEDGVMDQANLAALVKLFGEIDIF